ncbi:DoxX family protein [Novosphingobium sp.]|uniref:DoxX family protein n=1 Tax=Novosphingobium sp. TaxID=1874826 RepID=UPI00286C3915|nr:DoxX family protein [Novosphingobium sp.]
MSLLAAPLKLYDTSVQRLSGALLASLLLVFVRVVLGGIFWRSGQTKVADGTWFEITESTRELFRSEYAGVPLPPDIAAVMANAAEHILPALLLAGLFTRLSALGLLGMTLVIQIFVYPEEWWAQHALWAALALVLVLQGGGLLSLDALLARRRA